MSDLTSSGHDVTTRMPTDETHTLTSPEECSCGYDVRRAAHDFGEHPTHWADMLREHLRLGRLLSDRATPPVTTQRTPPTAA